MSSKAGWGLRKSLGKIPFPLVSVLPAGGPLPTLLASRGQSLRLVECEWARDSRGLRPLLGAPVL